MPLAHMSVISTITIRIAHSTDIYKKALKPPIGLVARGAKLLVDVLCAISQFQLSICQQVFILLTYVNITLIIVK